MKAVIRQVASAMFTQSMLSVANYALGIAIVRTAAKSEYGIYALLFSILGVASSCHGSLVTMPVVVLGPKKEGLERTQFTADLFYSQWLVFVPLVLGVIVGGGIYTSVQGEYGIMTYILVASLALLCQLPREFIRNVNYSKLRIRSVIRMDIFFVLVLGVCIVLMKTCDTVTGTMGIGALAAGYFAATLTGLRDADEEWKWSWTGIKSSFGESWQYSQWSVLGVAISALHGHGIIYVISFLSGLEAVAELSAARLLLMPLGLVLTSGGRIILAKGAVLLNARGADAFKKFILGFTFVLVSMWAGYVGLLAVSYEMLVGRMLGANYSGIGILVVLWSIIFFFICCRTAIALGLTVCKEMKASAKYDLIVSVVTLSSCVGLGTLWELEGALASLILGELTSCVLLTRKFVRVVRQLKSAEGEAGNEEVQAFSAPEEAV